MLVRPLALKYLEGEGGGVNLLILIIWKGKGDVKFLVHFCVKPPTLIVLHHILLVY